MHTMPVAHTEDSATQVLRKPVEVRTLSVANVTQDPSAVAASEVNRWMLLLGFPFIFAAGFFMAAISTGQQWLIGGALVTGPGLLIMAFVYLGLSSDTEGAR